MLLSSAILTGAAVDDQVITGTATAMVPFLMHVIPFDKLDTVYTIVMARKLQDKDTRAVMVNAHDFLSTWALMQADEAERAAEEAHQRALASLSQQEAELRRNPRKLHSIVELAARDGVTLPWNAARPGAVEAPRTADESEEAQQLRVAFEDSSRAEREASNRAAWARLISHHEDTLAKGKEGDDDV